MASCNNPDHAVLESELNDVLEEVLQLEDRIAAYEVTGEPGVAPELTQAETDTLVGQNVSLEKERDRYQQDYLTQKDRVNELETQLDDRNEKLKELDKLRRKLEEDLENTRKLLQTEKAKAADALQRAGGAEKTRRTEQRDQIRALQELQDLRECSKDLEAQNAEKDELVLELALRNQTQQELNETLTVQNEDLRGEANE
ncbi:unnamed protein product, partial [Choristocarpus tenellus]